MRILQNAIDPKRKSGFVVVCPTDEEDIWYCYNIILVGDVLRLKTMRKVAHQGGDYSVKTNKKILVKMLVRVLGVNFQADERGTSLLLKTKNLSDNQYVMKGQEQTVEVHLNQRLQVYKDCWDATALGYLEESADAAKNVDSVVVLLDEGYAAFYSIKKNFIKLHGKVAKSMPKKKTAIMDIYNKKAEEFDAAVWKYLFESFADWTAVKAVVLAGPGNVRVRVFDKLKSIDQHEKSEALRKAVKQNLYKFACIQTSSTFKSSISEIMKDKTGAKLLEDTKAVKEVKKLEEFYEIFMKNSNMAVFSEAEVRFANELGAVRSLLVTDGLLRAKNFHTRKRIGKLVEDIKGKGAEVFVFNEDHDSGSKLKDITGIAAILRFEIDVDSIRVNERQADDPQRFSEQSSGEAEERELNESFLANGDEFSDGEI